MRIVAERLAPTFRSFYRSVVMEKRDGLMVMTRIVWIALIAVGLTVCGSETTAVEDRGSTPPRPPDQPSPTTGLVPLTDLGTETYLGSEGGLYPDGKNDVPSDHAAAGAARVAEIRPLDAAGLPDPSGRIVLLAVGMSNVSQEFCGGPVSDCALWSFVGQAAADPDVDHATLAIVDGAISGRDAATWHVPGTYNKVRDERLTPLGLTEAQVQIVWMKHANQRPTISLPSSAADAFELEARLGKIVRTLADRYPNLRLVFVSSRIYAGWTIEDANPEPFAYESGFAVKWLIEAQIVQTRTGRVDPEAGDLDLASTPWLAWGPYLWAAGDTPRADGLTWTRADFNEDGTHPSPSGKEKVGRLLLEFFETSPFTRCWFQAGRPC